MPNIAHFSFSGLLLTLLQALPSAQLATQGCPSGMTYAIQNVICNGSTHDIELTLRTSQAVQYYVYRYESAYADVGNLIPDCQENGNFCSGLPFTEVCACDGGTWAQDCALSKGLTVVAPGFCTGLVPVKFYLTDVPNGQAATIFVNLDIVSDTTGGNITHETCNLSVTLPAQNCGCPNPPTASIAGPSSVCAGASQTFTASAAGGTPNYAYQWSTGQTGASISRSFASNTTLSVTVTDASGCTATASKGITIAPAPTAAFTSSANGLTASFTNTSSGASSYAWTFGDGGTSVQANPVHTYASGGTYNVCLTVTGACGSTQKCNNVTVTTASGPSPVANFTFNANSLTLTFTNNSTNATSYLWDFGDGGTSAQANPVHTYASADTYQICLTAMNAAGSIQRCMSVTIKVTPPCNLVSDSLELVAFFNATGGPNWDDNSGWLVPGVPIGDWHGVTLNASGCVHQLIVSSNNLVGSLIDLNLPNLQLFWCHNNSLSGSVPNFSNLPNLQEFICSVNSLSGTIPNFSNLPNLQEFFCMDNSLSGSIPNFSHLPNLQKFDCTNNSLSGTIPNFSNLPNLQVFGCSYNTLSGSIPDFQNLPNLQIFHCWFNQLSGGIPNFSNLPELRYLWCSGNSLSGSIPDFQNLPDLQNFVCGSNLLSGCFPAFVCNLNHFDATNNPLLPWQGDHTPFCSGSSQTGVPCDDGNAATTDDVIQGDCSCAGTGCTHPDKAALIELYEATGGDNWTNTWDTTSCEVCDWYGVTCDGDERVATLFLEDNNLSGVLPDLNLPYLLEFWCYYNQLSGGIPNFTHLPNLQTFLCNDNQLSGGIPNFTDLPNLQRFECGANPLSGSIPDFTDLPNLQFFECYGNQLSGGIPDFTSLPNLLSFVCSGNQLSGSIPDFTNLSNFQYFVCSGNQLSGSIPDFTNLPNLQWLVCIDNQLSGSIPAFTNLPNLQGIKCDNNQLSGSIPNFSNMPNLLLLWCSGNQLSGSIPDFANLPNFQYFDGSYNQLSGCLPAALQDFCTAGGIFNITGNPNLATQSWDNFCATQEGMCSSASGEAPAITFSLAPNPVASELQIWFEGAAQTNLELCLLDVLGNPILRQTLPSGEPATLKMSGLPAGVYFLRLSDKNGLSGTRRLVKL